MGRYRTWKRRDIQVLLSTQLVIDICIRIMLAMKQLLESKPLKNVRFFGKIFGRTKDYLICESEWKDGKEDEESKPPGPNKFTYWVINSRKTITCLFI